MITKLFGFLTLAAATSGTPFLGCLAFTNKLDHGKSMETIVLEHGKVHAKLHGPYQIQQWIPKLHAFLFARGNGVYVWAPRDKAPRLFLDAGKAVPALSNSTHSLVFALSPNLSTMAVYAEDADANHLWFVNTQSLTSRGILDDAAIRRSGAPVPAGTQELYGLAWTPDSKAVAVGVLGETNGRSSDGAASTECVLVSTDGKAKYLGQGVPVAWIDSSRLLCGRQVFDLGLDSVTPEILRLQSSKPKIGKGSGMFLAYDGVNIVFAMQKSLELLDENLAPIGTFKVAELQDSRWFQPPPVLVAHSAHGLP